MNRITVILNTPTWREFIWLFISLLLKNVSRFTPTPWNFIAILPLKSIPVTESADYQNFQDSVSQNPTSCTPSFNPRSYCKWIPMVQIFSVVFPFLSLLVVVLYFFALSHFNPSIVSAREIPWLTILLLQFDSVSHASYISIPLDVCTVSYTSYPS